VIELDQLSVDSLADALRRYRAAAEAGEVTAIIVNSDRSRNYYLQALLQPGYVLHCEAVSDINLEERYRIGAEGATRLLKLGWEEEKPKDPNWWRKYDFRSMDAAEPIADLFLRTLREVYDYRDGPVAIELV
jgi:hypothetical protein